MLLAVLVATVAVGVALGTVRYINHSTVWGCERREARGYPGLEDAARGALKGQVDDLDRVGSCSGTGEADPRISAKTSFRSVRDAQRHLRLAGWESAQRVSLVHPHNGVVASFYRDRERDKVVVLLEYENTSRFAP